jgi:hypothetical protein
MTSCISFVLGSESYSFTDESTFIHISSGYVDGKSSHAVVFSASPVWIERSFSSRRAVVSFVASLFREHFLLQEFLSYEKACLVFRVKFVQFLSRSHSSFVMCDVSSEELFYFSSSVSGLDQRAINRLFDTENRAAGITANKHSLSEQAEAEPVFCYSLVSIS